MPQHESSVKTPLPEPTRQFSDFHLEKSLGVEVLTTTPSKKDMMYHGTIVAGNSRRLSMAFIQEPAKPNDYPPLPSAIPVTP